MALEPLKLDQLTLVCPVAATYGLDDGRRGLGVNRLVMERLYRRRFCRSF